ncbi:MAG: LacI family DNA-binding transcriptional regulator [bacterium]
MNQPTQTDVAQLAGVSRATVSYVINGLTDGKIAISDETRKRVEDAIEELGYEPDARAQALSSGRTNTVALVIPDLRNPHFSEFATGVEDAARAADYHFLLSSTTLVSNEYAVDIFKDLVRRRFDGLILASSFILKSKEAQRILARVHKRGLPIVEVNEINHVDTISADYREATKEVISYLVSLGHRRIGLIYGVGDHEHGLDRLESYQEGLNTAGIALDPGLIVECGPAIEDGYQGALKLLQLDFRPSAIVAINDLLAIGTVRAAGDLGMRVPDDLSVVGYDDIPMANYLMPRLTTVTKDAYAAGQRAFEMLMERMQTPDLPRQLIHMPATLVVRESTGQAPF